MGVQCCTSSRAGGSYTGYLIVSTPWQLHSSGFFKELLPGGACGAVIDYLSKISI